MSGHRPQGMRGRGRARYRDGNTPSPTPGHTGNKDSGDGRESPSTVWKHDRYSRHGPSVDGLGTNSPDLVKTDTKREPASQEKQRKGDRVRNRRPDVQVYVPRARRQPAGTEITSPQRSTTSTKPDNHRKVRPEKEIYVPKQQKPHHDENVSTASNHDSYTNTDIQHSKQDREVCNEHKDTEIDNIEVDPAKHPSKKIKVFDKRKHFERFMHKVDYKSFPPQPYQDSDEDEEIPTNVSVSNSTDIKTTQECSDLHSSDTAVTDNKTVSFSEPGSELSGQCKNVVSANENHWHLQPSCTETQTSDSITNAGDSEGIICDKDRTTLPSVIDGNSEDLVAAHQVLHSADNKDSHNAKDGLYTANNDGLYTANNDSERVSNGSTTKAENEDNSTENMGNACESERDAGVSIPITVHEDCRETIEQNKENLTKTDKACKNASDSDSDATDDKAQNEFTEQVIKSQAFDKQDITELESITVMNRKNDVENMDGKDQVKELCSKDSEACKNASDLDSDATDDKAQNESTVQVIQSQAFDKQEITELESITVMKRKNSVESMDGKDQVEELCSKDSEEKMLTDGPKDEEESISLDLNSTQTAPCDKDMIDSSNMELTRNIEITTANSETMNGDIELISSDSVSKNNPQSEPEDPEEDSWDAMFNDDGDCLDPKALDELTKTVGNVKIQKSKKINYLDYQPKDKGNFDYTQYAHIIEIYDFPKEFVTRDLIMAFQSFMSRGFDLKWVDDTHALGIFSSAIAAQDALMMIHPLVKVRSLIDASKPAQDKARRCTEFLQPYKPRPETTASAARRLVAGALGLASNVPKEKRDRERQQLKEAKEKRRKDRKNREEIWEFGKCAMDENP